MLDVDAMVRGPLSHDPARLIALASREHPIGGADPQTFWHYRAVEGETSVAMLDAAFWRPSLRAPAPFNRDDVLLVTGPALSILVTIGNYGIGRVIFRADEAIDPADLILPAQVGRVL